MVVRSFGFRNKRRKRAGRHSTRSIKARREPGDARSQHQRYETLPRLRGCGICWLATYLPSYVDARPVGLRWQRAELGAGSGAEDGWYCFSSGWDVECYRLTFVDLGWLKNGISWRLETILLNIYPSQYACIQQDEFFTQCVKDPTQPLTGRKHVIDQILPFNASMRG